MQIPKHYFVILMFLLFLRELIDNMKLVYCRKTSKTQNRLGGIYHIQKIYQL